MENVAEKRGHLDIKLFGHFEAALDGEPLRFATPRKTLQVLAYCLLHRGAPVSREYLAYLLYPDDEEGSARAKLRATLSDLQKLLPRPADRYVTIDAEKIEWNSEAPVSLDVDRFSEAAADPERLGEAIDLYRGDLLPEVYDEWLDAIRERLRNGYLRCLSERVSQARRNADLALAIETARRILTVDPWREDMVRRIVAMRYESGDRAGALSEYAAFAKRLRAEMGTEPMAETAAVAERIARGEASGGDEDGDERIPRVEAVLPFVGRHDEMERLTEMWSRVARGRGACAFVSGESGIGKTRTVLELAHAIEDRGGRALVGTTSSPETVPYEAAVDALRSALPLVASLKPSVALACVATLLPEILGRVTLPAIPRLDAESERIRLFESLFRTLAALAAQRPLLLVLEDLHWAQPASLELLEFLLRRVSAVPVMIVVTHRDEESPQLHALQRLRRETQAAAGTASVRLGHLSLDDVEQLRETLADARARAADTLLAASQGNPLFLTQLVVEVREGAENENPPSLQAAVERRVERLSERARSAAEIAACIGERFSREAVREVSAWDEAALTDALDELLDRRIVREAAGRGILEYTFAHHLLHDVVARAVPPKDAAIRRRRVARVLERLYPERVSELSALLAGHYEAAGDVENAARCYLEAVRRSTLIGALHEARTLCDRALALDVTTRMRADLLLESATIESRGGNRRSWDAVLQALENTDAALGDDAIHRSALLHRIEFAWRTSDLALHEQSVRALRESISPGDAHSMTALHLAEAKLQFTLGHLAESYASGEAALACSRSVNDDAGATGALCSLAQVEAHRGRLSAAEALFDEAAEYASRAADPVLEQLALNSGWIVAYQRRDLARCHALGTRSLELAVGLGDRPGEAQAHARLGVTLTAQGTQYARARDHFAQARRISAETGNLTGTAGQLLNQALLETRLGFFERAVAATEKAVEIFESVGDERGRAGGLTNLIFLRACVGEIAAARQAAGVALEVARKFGFGLLEASALENLGNAEAAAGDYARAVELAEASFDVRSRSESQVWSSKTLADVAIWYAALGNLPAARDAARRLLADEDAILRATEWPAYCYWAAAQIFHLASEEAEAAKTLDRARRMLLAAADELESEDRERFLAIPWHVDLMAAATDDRWPSPPR